MQIYAFSRKTNTVFQE